MPGISPVSPTLSGQHPPVQQATEPRPGERRVDRSQRRRDAGVILLAWAVSLCLSLFVQPHPGETSVYELVYYAFYNVGVGAFVGFHLFERLPKDGFALFALRALPTLFVGTLANEMLVERFFFGMEPINGVGVYYGLTDSLSWTVIFILLRLAGKLQVLAPPETLGRQDCGGDSTNAVDPGAAWLFVRAADGIRRIRARDVVCMEAERDFTRIICATGEHFVSESLKRLLERSSKLGLVRVHKSYAVNVCRVERLTRTEVHVGDRRVPLGRRYRADFIASWQNRRGP